MPWEITDSSAKTRTAETEAQYRQVYLSFVRRADAQGDELQTRPMPEEVLVVQYFMSHRHEWTLASERRYASAIQFVLGEKVGGSDPIGGAIAARARQDFVARLRPEKAPPDAFRSDQDWADALGRAELARKKRRQISEDRKMRGEPPRTSGRKQKSICPATLSAVLDALDSSESSAAADAKRWFRAGMLTGLRPSEWPFARLAVGEDGAWQLTVRNGKNSNGRTFGLNRTIELDGLEPHDVHLLSIHLRQIELAMAAPGGYKSWYRACREAIRSAMQKRFPHRKRRPTLYSARHIFAANAKGQFDKRTVAALMGHGSESTAGMHYAPARSGCGSLGVRPSSRDMVQLSLHLQNRGPTFKAWSHDAS